MQIKKKNNSQLVAQVFTAAGQFTPPATYTSRDASNFAKIAGTKVVNILTLTTSIEDRNVGHKI